MIWWNNATDVPGENRATVSMKDHVSAGSVIWETITS